ncbi:MAG: hypothetical protein ACOC85_02555 [Thermoplasmatota archaeon]
MKRSIIHFAQPHTPYLHPEFEPIRGPVARKKVKGTSGSEVESNNTKQVRDEVRPIIEEFIGFERTYNLRYNLSLTGSSANLLRKLI